MPHVYGARVALEGKNRRRGSCDLLMLVRADGSCIARWHARGEEFQSACEGENLFVPAESLIDYLDHIVVELRSNRNDAARIAHALLLAFWLTLQRELQEGQYQHLGSPAHRRISPAPVTMPWFMRENTCNRIFTKT